MKGLEMSNSSKKFRPWRAGFPWFLVDSRGHVRGCVHRCLRTEAEAIAKAMFGESMEAYPRTDLSVPQRMESIAFPPLTPEKLKALGIDFESVMDVEERSARKASLRAHHAQKAARASGGGQ